MNKSVIHNNSQKNDFSVVRVEKPNLVANSINRAETNNVPHTKKNNEIVNVNDAAFLNDMVKNLKTFSGNENLAVVNHNVFNTTYSGINNSNDNNSLGKNINPLISEPDAVTLISGEIHE